MGTARDLGLMMLRVGVGASCVSHGAQQLTGRLGDGGAEDPAETRAVGLEPAELDIRPSAVLETAGGALLALGLASGPVSAALTGNMIVASSGQPRNGLVQTSEEYQRAVAYALVGSTLALTGPGRFSLDQLTGRALNRPWMRVLALIGALTTAAYLVTIRSVVLEEDDEED
jgi:putative oxidoreductase